MAKKGTRFDQKLKELKEASANKDWQKVVTISEWLIKNIKSNTENERKSEIFTFYGYSLGHLQRDEEAVQALTRAIELDENDPNLYGLRGFMFGRLRQYTESFNDFNKLLQIKPGDSTAYLYRGLALARLDRHED